MREPHFTTVRRKSASCQPTLFNGPRLTTSSFFLPHLGRGLRLNLAYLSEVCAVTAPREPPAPSANGTSTVTAVRED